MPSGRFYFLTAALAGAQRISSAVSERAQASQQTRASGSQSQPEGRSMPGTVAGQSAQAT